MEAPTVHDRESVAMGSREGIPPWFQLKGLPVMGPGLFEASLANYRVYRSTNLLFLLPPDDDLGISEPLSGYLMVRDNQ